MLYSPPYAFRYEAPLVVAYYDSTGTRASMCSPLYFGDRLMSVQAPKTPEPVPLQRPGRSAASKEPAWWSPSCDDLLRDWRGAARITQDLSGRSPARISGDFFELPGAISGFRQYEKAGFDKFIETMTNEWWTDVHREDSKCGRAHGNKWDSGCRRNTTLILWQPRKVVPP